MMRVNERPGEGRSGRWGCSCARPSHRESLYCVQYSVCWATAGDVLDMEPDEDGRQLFAVQSDLKQAGRGAPFVRASCAPPAAPNLQRICSAPQRFSNSAPAIPRVVHAAMAFPKIAA